MSTRNWEGLTNSFMFVTTVICCSLNSHYHCGYLPPRLFLRCYVILVQNVPCFSTSTTVFLVTERKLTRDETYLTLATAAPPRMPTARPDMAAVVPACQGVPSSQISHCHLAAMTRCATYCLLYTRGGSFNRVTNLFAFRLQRMRRSS